MGVVDYWPWMDVSISRKGTDVAVGFREEAVRVLMVTERSRRMLRCMGGSRQASGLKMVIRIGWSFDVEYEGFFIGRVKARGF